MEEIQARKPKADSQGDPKLLRKFLKRRRPMKFDDLRLGDKKAPTGSEESYALSKDQLAVFDHAVEKFRRQEQLLLHRGSRDFSRHIGLTSRHIGFTTYTTTYTTTYIYVVRVIVVYVVKVVYVVGICRELIFFYMSWGHIVKKYMSWYTSWF